MTSIPLDEIERICLSLERGKASPEEQQMAAGLLNIAAVVVPALTPRVFNSLVFSRNLGKVEVLSLIVKTEDGKILTLHDEDEPPEKGH